MAENLNYGDAGINMTVRIYYNCVNKRIFNVTFPSGFTVINTGAPCGKINNSLVSCDFLPASNQGWYYFSGSGNVADHTLLELTTWLNDTNNCSISNNITIINKSFIIIN